MESMRAADANNWSLNPEEFATLATSLNNFFQQTGLLQEGAVVPGFPLTAPPSANSQNGNSVEHHSNNNSNSGGGAASPNSENGVQVGARNESVLSLHCIHNNIQQIFVLTSYPRLCLDAKVIPFF